MNHSPADYDRLYDFSREVLSWHKLAERRRRCAIVILEYSFRLRRAVAAIPTLDIFGARAQLDKSHVRRALLWLDAVGIARCYTDRGVYLYRPDYRQWDHARAPLWWDPDKWKAIHEQLVLIPADPTLDDALACVSREAMLSDFLAVTGAVTVETVGGASTEAPTGLVGAGFDPRSADPVVAGPATTCGIIGVLPVAGPATKIVNNPLARASGEPVTGNRNREPVFEGLPEPVSVAGPATTAVATPATAADRQEILRRIGNVCGHAEIVRNSGRWLVAWRDHRLHLLHAVEDTELQAPRGFTTCAGAFLNKRYNDNVAGRVPRWRKQPQEIHPC